MKKLFAGIVAVLALIPVVANAASYSVGDYIDFAGNEDDWRSFNATGSAQETAEWLDTYAVSSIYIGDSSHTDSKGNKYLKVLQLKYYKGYAGGVADEDDAIDADVDHTPYTDTVKELRTHIESPYGYFESSKLVVNIASLAEVKSVLGVTGSETTIELTDLNKFILGTITGASGATDAYVFTNTAGTTDATKYFAVKVDKNSAGEITEATIVEKEREYVTDFGFVFTTLEMNEAFTCKSSSTDTYSCYECPTTEENKTEYLWRRDGAQADACKKVEKITSKAKCVKSPKTGVDSYLVPSAIVLGVCAIVLTVLKRKDAFKAI